MLTTSEMTHATDELQTLLDEGRFDGPAEGIVEKFIKLGQDCLTGKRYDVFQDFVIKPWFSLGCEICGRPIPAELYSKTSRSRPLCGQHNPNA